MSARSLPLVGLGFGAYLLGIATALLLIPFHGYPEAWQRISTAIVAGLGILCISSAVAWTVKCNNTVDTDAFDVGSIPERPVGSTTVASIPPSYSGRTPDLDESPRQLQQANYGTVPDRDVPQHPAGDSASENGDHGFSQREPTVPIDETQPLAEHTGHNDLDVLAEPEPADLIEVWETYRREGDGHFTAKGFQDQLDARNLTAAVRENEQVGPRDCVLVVETPSRRPYFYVVPSFTKSPRKVSHWFDDRSDGALNGKIERVLEIAKGRWTESGVGDTIKKGVVA